MPSRKNAKRWFQGGAILVALVVGFVAGLVVCHRRQSTSPNAVVPRPGTCARTVKNGEYWATFPLRTDTAPPVDCMYVAGELIAQAGIDTRKFNLTRADDNVIPAVGPYPSLALYKLDSPEADPLDIALRLIENKILAAPNYLLFTGQIVRYGPYNEPSPAPTGTPPPNSLGATALTPVTVLDTGLDTSAWKAPLVSWPVPNWGGVGQPIEPPGPIAGHGTFIASIIERAIANAKVTVVPTPKLLTVTIGPGLQRLAIDDNALAKAIGQTTDPILNLSWGSAACGGSVEGGGTPIVTPTVTSTTNDVCLLPSVRNALLTRHIDTAHPLQFVAAAAGNAHVQTRSYPAAYALNACFDSTTPSPKTACPSVSHASPTAWLLSVGTSDGSPTGPAPGAGTAVAPLTCERATNSNQSGFSNYGNWVTVLAEGGCVYGYLPDTATAKAGIYEWSGTSFAAPCIAAYLAAGMANEVRNSVTQLLSGSQVELSCKSHLSDNAAR